MSEERGASQNTLKHQREPQRETLQALSVAFTLPQLKAYRDRVAFALALAELSEIKRLYLLTPRGQSEREELLGSLPKHLTSTFKLIELPERGYERAASAWVLERLSLGALDIIHDTFGHLATALEGSQSQKKSRRWALITTLYTSNTAWFERVLPLKLGLNLRYALLRAQGLWLDARLTRAVDRVAVLGLGHERELERSCGLSPHKVRLVPSEVDTERFCPAFAQASLSEHKTEAKAKNKEAQHKVKTPSALLYVGALSRNKGLDLLLELFEGLVDERPHLTLTLIGRTPPFEERWLKGALKRCRARDRITLHPHLPQEALIEHYQSADLYLLPSLFEGSPRALREAIACGCVAISSHLPGCLALDPQGEYLHFAPPRDLSVWRDRVREALDEPHPQREQRSARGVARMRAHHHPSAVARAYLALYQEALTERKAHAHQAEGTT